MNAIMEYLEEEETIGGYKLEEDRADQLDQLYLHAAEMLNCEPQNIAFANNATDAYSKALSSIPFEKDDVVILSDDDYVSNYMHFITLRKRHKILIRRIRNLDNGDLDLEHFQKLVQTHRPKLVSVSHVPTSSGIIQNVNAIGKICADNEITYLVDACQSIGQMPIDCQAIQCDFLSATGRKFLRGPRGTGLLYVSDRILFEGNTPLYVDLGGAEWTDVHSYQAIKSARRFEFWERPCALIRGLSEALRYANNLGLERVQKYNQTLTEQLRRNLSELKDVTVFDRGSKLSNICTWKKEGKSLKATKDHLDKNDVFYSIVDRNSALIDFDKKKVDWVVRFSPHYFNTKNEINQAVEIVQNL